MFEAMVVSLGAFRILKSEDNGRVYSDGTYAAPDFRIVLPDGKQWLVEVKNAYMPDAHHQSRRFMTNGYREKLEKYALATGAYLKLAVYWARWGIWTLVSPSQLVGSDGSVTLDMLTAIKANEMGSLGDMMIGTKPPLRLRLATDPAHTTPVAADGTVQFTIADVQVFCGEEELADSVEREIAWILMNYGDWAVSEPEAILKERSLEAVEFRWEPLERQNAGYEVIGMLSQFFTRYYSRLTIDDQEIVQLYAPQRPGWFSSLVDPDQKTKSLPLWRFIQKPDYADE